SATGRVLVGADGVGSTVRRQYLPHPRVVDTGVVAVGGRLPIVERPDDQVPRVLTTRMNNVLPPGGSPMFVAPYIRRPRGRCAPPSYRTTPCPITSSGR